MSEQNIYPVVYSAHMHESKHEQVKKQEPNYIVSSARLNLELDNIDELATKWITDKAYAFAERLVGMLQYLSTMAVGGFAGLSVHYLATTYVGIMSMDGLRTKQMTYYRHAHSECNSQYNLTYYNRYDVDRSFGRIQKTITRSGIMLAVAGAMVATSFGMRWLRGYIVRARKASQNTK